MAITDEARKTLADLLYLLRRMTKDGNLEPEWYYKALVAGAHELLVAGETDWAIDLLAKVPAEYYAEDITVHMELDSSFAEKAFQVARVLIATSMVHLGFSEEERKNVQAV